MIINPQSQHERTILKIGTVCLKYLNTVKYLGVFLNHNGSIENDIQLSTTKCKSEIIIKLTNF